MVFIWMAVRPQRITAFYDWFAERILPSRIRIHTDSVFDRFLEGLRSLSNPNDVLKNTPITNLSRGDYLVGFFQHADGRRAVLLNNYSFAYTAWPTVDFAAPVEQVREVCQQTGKEIPLVDDSPAMEGLQLSLDSGEGRLFLLPR